ncbi:hypothetical protein [Massilia sp. KIM]|uniref:hypothetical protein n=1 Tax=Massilia sp. KIM TaxID=1955422 RepID=UPI0015C31F1D|nr:hypothetical protein [Massilia sp. KIM]
MKAIRFLQRWLMLACFVAAPALAQHVAHHPGHDAAHGAAQQAKHDATYGSHGMALFGDRDGLYASHLPMFRAPHDHQMVLQVRLSDPKLDRTLRERMQGTTALWTIDPERFELSRLGPGAPNPVRAFQAKVFSGHFERDGKEEIAQAGFVVEKVLLFERLDPSVRARAQAHYLPVGKYLVKRLDSRPDYDHILKLAGPAPAPLTVAKDGMANPEAALRRLAPVVGTVYFETGDLR